MGASYGAIGDAPSAPGKASGFLALRVPEKASFSAPWRAWIPWRRVSPVRGQSAVRLADADVPVTRDVFAAAPHLRRGACAGCVPHPISVARSPRANFQRRPSSPFTESLDRGAAFLNQDAGTLSGGEGQITALVRALLLDPSVLLLDEATSALDSETVRRVERLLGSWCQETPGRALVWVSHDPAQRARVFQRELLLVPAADA